MSQHKLKWSWHSAAHYFHLALLFQSFNIGLECKIIFQCVGSPQLIVGFYQSETHKLHWSGKMHIISKLSDWLRLPIVFVDWVTVFLENVHRILIEELLNGLHQTFLLFIFILLFQQVSQILQHSVKILINYRPASKSVIMTKLPGSSRTVVFVLRTKVFANAILKHYLHIMFTKIVRMLRTGLMLFQQLCVFLNPIVFDH